MKFTPTPADFKKRKQIEEWYEAHPLPKGDWYYIHDNDEDGKMCAFVLEIAAAYLGRKCIHAGYVKRSSKFGEKVNVRPEYKDKINFVLDIPAGTGFELADNAIVFDQHFIADKSLAHKNRIDINALGDVTDIMSDDVCNIPCVAILISYLKYEGIDVLDLIVNEMKADKELVRALACGDSMKYVVLNKWRDIRVHWQILLGNTLLVQAMRDMFADESLIPIDDTYDKVQWNKYYKLYITTPYYDTVYHTSRIQKKDTLKPICHLQVHPKKRNNPNTAEIKNTYNLLQ
ncbi:hypothetical protein [Bacillus toyonensis]|uniref:Uncharacterized protein n=1 Tax=Bacillus toyonensis TaxID=155322 RepID=A0A2C4QZ26_9BACI|nr:hypothetical protein [Bacillus toyonensis]PHD69781.1 hypothetical protein COF40_15070 [Bacillus toyonensis]